MTRICVAGLTLFVIAGGMASSAVAKTLRLNWKERTPNCCAYPAMVFTVRSVTATTRGRLVTWSVRAEILNRSPKTISITKGDRYIPSKHDFAILAPPTSCTPPPPPSPIGRCDAVDHKATYFKPKLPSSLAPGRSWRGVFGGRAALPRRKLLEIAFGAFVPEGGNPFSWLTQHSFRL